MASVANVEATSTLIRLPPVRTPGFSKDNNVCRVYGFLQEWILYDGCNTFYETVTPNAQCAKVDRIPVTFQRMNVTNGSKHEK